MQTLLEVVRKTEGFFAQKGIENPRLNAELLFAQVMDCKRLDLYLQFDRPLEESMLEKLRPLVARRAKGEPLQYITGETDFYDVKITCDQRALIPRPETEELVELLFNRLGENPPKRILDLGTGTGAIALALAKNFPEAEVWAVDASPQALALAKENAEKNGLSGRVTFLQSDWFAKIPSGQQFDLIVSNPPYLTEEEWQSAAIQVREHEPKEALVAEAAGASDLLRIIEAAADHLTSAGLLALETGIAQHSLLAEAKSYGEHESLQDLSDRDRFFLLRKG